MNYPGDSLVLSLVLQHDDGTLPTVTIAPTVLVLNALTGAQVISPAVAMNALAGTRIVYTCSISTSGLALGTYIAVASYAVDGVVFQNRFLQSFQLGDTYISGPVALQATVAKEATVAKDATVMHRGDFVSPDQSPTLLQMSAKLAGWPAAIPSSADLTSLMAFVTDIRDCSLGSWAVDKTTNIMTLYRVSGAQLVSFQLQNSTNQSLRSRQ